MPDELTREERLARAGLAAERALELHPFYRGKVQVAPKCPVSDPADFAVWYTPGVAAPCRDIHAHPERVYDHTNRGNSVAIVSDGSRVLGLGDIGPEAGLPVMEGKALLFKVLGGVDAVPLCVRTRSADELVHVVEAIAPSFGGVNLEDIAQPKCFRVLERLRASLDIPVWHDDQQGTATVLLAALTNALTVVDKRLDDVRITLVGVGAANVPTFRLLVASGVDPGAVIACDSRGTLHTDRGDLSDARELYPDKWHICEQSNRERVSGGIAEALRGSDVCIALSAPGPGVIEPGWIRSMAADAIVFACANPIPEIWPWDAHEAGARIVATGRSDFPNQVNNSLGFPGIFRGVLDVRARTVSDEMAIAAARELARFAVERGLRDDSILPGMHEWEAVPHVAAATAMTAQELGLAELQRSHADVYASAVAAIRAARDQARTLEESGRIAPAPDAENRASAPTGSEE